MITATSTSIWGRQGGREREERWSRRGRVVHEVVRTRKRSFNAKVDEGWEIREVEEKE